MIAGNKISSSAYTLEEIDKTSVPGQYPRNDIVYG
jgi:hypothetical protein